MRISKRRLDLRLLALAPLLCLATLSSVASFSRAEEPSAIDVPLQSPSFETAGPDGLPDGWEAAVGATTNGDGSGKQVASTLTLDEAQPADGKASVRFEGAAGTTNWRLLWQTVPVEAGQRVELLVAARSHRLRRENGQFANANALVQFEDASGKRLQFTTSPVLSRDRAWIDLAVHAWAPPGATRMRVGVFASMTGRTWFDNVRLRVADADMAKPASRLAAFEALRGHLQRTYSFFGVAGRPDADTLFEQHREPILAAADRGAFLDAVCAMLGDLDDPHVWVKTPQGIRGTQRPRETVRNWNLNAIQKALDEVTVRQRNLIAGRIGKGKGAFGYVLIGSWQMNDAAAKELHDAVDALADTKALIFDVRANGGGNENYALGLAARFTTEPLPYAVRRTRDPTLHPNANQHFTSTEGFGPSRISQITPRDPTKADKRRVVVLQGAVCMSSTEGFLQMAKALPNWTTIGARSRGASANPQPFQLLPDVVVMSSTWQAYYAGELLEGVGINPDVELDLPQPAFATTDPVLERAVDLLRSGK